MLELEDIPRLGDHVVQLLDLSLRSSVCSQSLLGELSGTLVLGVSEQLDDSSLIWCKSCNLSDQVSDESGSLGESSLSSRRLYWSSLKSSESKSLEQITKERAKSLHERQVPAFRSDFRRT